MYFGKQAIIGLMLPQKAWQLCEINVLWKKLLKLICENMWELIWSKHHLNFVIISCLTNENPLISMCKKQQQVVPNKRNLEVKKHTASFLGQKRTQYDLTHFIVVVKFEVCWKSFEVSKGFEYAKSTAYKKHQFTEYRTTPPFPASFAPK